MDGGGDPPAQIPSALLVRARIPTRQHSQTSHRTPCLSPTAFSAFAPPPPSARLHSYVDLLQSLLSHCLFVILSFYSIGLSDAARCHYAAVTAGAGAITRHTHHGKHTCLCAFMHSRITRTRRRARTGRRLCPRRFCPAQVAKSHKGDCGRRSNGPPLNNVTEEKLGELLGHLLSVSPAWPARWLVTPRVKI